MYTDQLPLINILPLVALFLAPVAYRFAIAKAGLSRKEIIGCAIAGLALTLASLMLYGSRGGLPGADVYGWPKEYIIVRDGARGFYLFYFLIDLVFYASVAAGVSALGLVPKTRSNDTNRI